MNEPSPELREPTRSGVVGNVIWFCMTRKIVVFLLIIAFCVWGLMVAPFDWDIERIPRDPVPVDAIPDIGENQQIVFTAWMGRSPQDVEDQITYPLTVSLLGIPGVRTVRSNSMFGFSMVYIIFKDNVDFYWSRSRILEKLNSLPAGTLPAGVQPALGPDATALGQIFWYTLEGRDKDNNPTGGWDLGELRTIQDWYVRYSLLSADGISEVASVGGFVKEYQIDVDPDAMRVNRVTLNEVFSAVRMSNVDVGARTIEVNKVEYVIRGLGFIKKVSDVEDIVIKSNDNVPIFVKDVAHVSLGPGLRRGALDKEGAEVVGGVVVVRYGENPLAAIKNVKKKIQEISPGLPRKTLADGTVSQVKIVPFYDRTGLIHETLGTLDTALTEEILVTVIVVIVMVMHLKSSMLISGLLPLAILMCFIAMKLFGVDANVVALSGIAIAIGTMVDMGIVICENILNHLNEAGPEENRLHVVFRAANEVGSAVLTAVATTVVGFLPVFTMQAAEGKLFRPLAFTKTFALLGSIVVALTIIPPMAHILFSERIVKHRRLRRLAHLGVVLAGVFVTARMAWWAGVPVLLVGLYHLFADWLPERLRKGVLWGGNGVAVLLVAWLLARHWLPLGPEKGVGLNLLFVGMLLGGLLGAVAVIQWTYGRVLRWALRHKALFLLMPGSIVALGAYVWLGPGAVLGPAEQTAGGIFAGQDDIGKLADHGLLTERHGHYLWTNTALQLSAADFRSALEELKVSGIDRIVLDWEWSKRHAELKAMRWEAVRNAGLGKKIKWTLARDWDGRGKEFMPPLDEGSFLFMPTTMPHASIGECLDVLSKQNMGIRAIPEVDTAVGKIGRAETALDPAPISMIETVINYKPEYVVEEGGRRLRFKFTRDETDYFRSEDGKPVAAPDGKPYVVAGKFARDKEGRLIPDDHGMPFRLWRPALDPALNSGREAWKGIRTPDDIWKLILGAAEVPGTTSAPRLQPIMARIVMLQSGMRAPMGVKVTGPDLKTIENVGVEIERLLKHVPSVDPASVIADRIVGKPYLEIDIDRKAIARYGIKVGQVQQVIEVAVGGMKLTTTVEGRERYPVRVRYMRELRDSIDALGRILVSAPDGTQVPLIQLAQIRYVPGPQSIKSEDTFLVGYVLFDMKAGYAEVEVVQEAQQYLEQKRRSGEFVLPPNVTYRFAGNYENQIRAQKRLSVVLPLALFIIFLILYFQFNSVVTTGLVFSGIVVAGAGGFVMLWFYSQPWFLDFTVFGVNMQELFQVHPINLSVAVWVGFLALFGIASDDGVVMGTYLVQSFEKVKPATVEEIREATLAAGRRRIRPCMMTTATTILALLPVLSSRGRGSDIMVPMAIPGFGGMVFEVLTMFVVPILYCWIREIQLKTMGVVPVPSSPEPSPPTEEAATGDAPPKDGAREHGGEAQPRDRASGLDEGESGASAGDRSDRPARGGSDG